MILEAPALKIKEQATEKLIEQTISSLEPVPYNFAILSEGGMSYLQCLRTENGYIVQFQVSDMDNHYEFETYLSRPQTIQLFTAYLEKIPNWQGDLPYFKVELRSFWFRLGRSVGNFFGQVSRGFREAREDNK